jgi:hypothetical protein
LTAVVEKDRPKMPSVAGILSHLMIEHGEGIRQAMWALVEVINNATFPAIAV